MPYPEKVHANYLAWFAQHDREGHRFTPEQVEWLLMIRDHIATSLSIEVDDFELTPFQGKGGLGKVFELFGDGLPELLHELSEALAA